MASDPTIRKTARVPPRSPHSQSVARQVEREDVAAQVKIARGQYWEAFFLLRPLLAGGANDPDEYPLMQTAATALRNLAARYAPGNRVSQRLRIDLLEQAATLLHEARDLKGLYRVYQAILQARLSLGEPFSIALAAHKNLALGLDMELATGHDITTLARLLADHLDRTVLLLRGNDKATWKQVSIDKIFQGGEHLTAKALAYRATADGLPAAVHLMEKYLPMYRDAAESYYRGNRILQAMFTLGQGVLLGTALGLPGVLDATADRLVFFATQADDADAIGAVERSIALVRNGFPEEAHRGIVLAARRVLNQLPGPLDIEIFLGTRERPTEYLWHKLEENIRLRRGGPDGVAAHIRQQVDIVRRQYALWGDVLDRVMSLVRWGDIGSPLHTFVEEGFKQFFHWTDASRDLVVTGRIAKMGQEDPTSAALTHSAEFVRMVGSISHTNPEVFSVVVQILAETYGVERTEIVEAFLPGMEMTPLAERLRRDLSVSHFHHIAHVAMLNRYLTRRYDWDRRVR